MMPDRESRFAMNLITGFFALLMGGMCSAVTWAGIPVIETTSEIWVIGILAAVGTVAYVIGIICLIEAVRLRRRRYVRRGFF
jgi:hypothetical protein